LVRRAGQRRISAARFLGFSTANGTASLLEGGTRMRWALSSSLRFGGLVIALAIGLMVFGITQLRSAPVDVYPEFKPPAVQIQTEALGLSAAEVEQLITVPIEQDLLNGVPFLDRIHSTSMAGLSAIDLTFKSGTDVYAARQLVQERMSQAHALPGVGSPPVMIPPLASASRIAMVGLSSRDVSLVDMSILARWKIRPRLMGVPGVANVSIYGQRDRQLQVQVDPGQLRAKDVSLTQVIETTGNALWVSPLTFVEASTPGTGGFVESPNQRLQVQHISPITTPRQLSEVPLENEDGLRLGDVATVIEDHQPLIGDAVARGAPSLFLVIDKFPDANTREVTTGVEEALAEMGPGLKGITVDPNVHRPATFIETALTNVGIVGLVGLALLLAVMFLVFASWRAAVIAFVVVPVSLTVAAYVLYLQGATFTTITLLGLAAAVGLMIDDVVTDVGAVRRLLADRGREPESASATMLAAFLSTRRPLLFATVAIVLATLPFWFMGTFAAAFSRPLVLTFCLAVLASMLVAFTLTPALAALLMRGDAAAREGPLARWVKRLFDRRITGLLARPGRAWAVAGVLAVATLAIVPQIGNRSMLPSLQDRNLLLQVQAISGTSLPEMNRIVAAASSELRTVPGVERVGAHVGRAVTSDQLVDVNSAEMWITLDDAADYDRTTAAIRTVMRGYPGLKTGMGTYPGELVAQMAAGQDDDLVVRLYGDDLSTLQQKAREVRTMLSGVPGVANPVVRPIVQQPTATVRVKLAEAQKHGLRPGDVRREATTLTSGLVVGNLYEQSKIFDVVVWGTPSSRSDLTGMGNLLINTPSGRQVALKDVATIKVQPEPTAITHDEVLRNVEVVAKVTGDPGSAVDTVRSRLAALPMPYEYHARVFGNATVERADVARTLAYGAAALIGVFLLLQAAVASWRRAGLLLLSLPLSVVGGVLIAPLAGGVWNTGSLAGLFVVFALAIRSAVLLGYQIREPEQGGAARGGTVVLAARERSVSLLQTVLVTAAVLMPAAVIGTGPGLELLQPLAVTVLGGLMSLVAVQGYVLPALLTTTTAAAGEPERDTRPAAEPALD
jgi:Cu/Ag efflux pump CusA